MPVPHFCVGNAKACPLSLVDTPMRPLRHSRAPLLMWPTAGLTHLHCAALKELPQLLCEECLPTKLRSLMLL